MTPDQLRAVIRRVQSPGPMSFQTIDRLVDVAPKLLELWEAVDESIQEAALFEPRVRKAHEELKKV